jgi:GNAT superfamily N-acetyltransferase
MALRLDNVQDADVEDTFRIQHIAFRNADTIGQFICPTPLPSEEYLASASPRRRNNIRENPNVHFVKVVDTAADKMIACAHWVVYPYERSEDDVTRLSYVPPPPANVVPEAWNDFFNHMSKGRKDLGTQPMVILHSLNTLPDHHRRGAGTMLLNRFVEDVDRFGLLVYLEASEAGKPLYERYGFKSIHVTEFPLERYGGKGTDYNTLMIREARPKPVGEQVLAVPPLS